MPHLRLLMYFAPKGSPATKEGEEQQEDFSFTVSYLINSCGLSLETAKYVSKRVQFETPEGPNSVLSLLRDNGFTDTHISKVVKKLPRVLLSDAKRTLLPKLEFFCSVGLSKADLGSMFVENPILLHCSLKDKLIPRYNFVKSVLVLDEKVVTVLKRSTWICSKDLEKNVIPNISLLRGLGMSQPFISALMTSNAHVLCRSAEKFSERVEKVVEMGFSPSTTKFVWAIVAFNFRESTFKHKMEVYRRWGWSDDEIWSAFRKRPICMCLSEEKIMSGMDFFVNKMGRHYSDIVKYPHLLFYSMEKRIIPRCLVFKILLLKGLITKDFSLSTVVKSTEKYFYDRFVIRYQKDVPQLLSIYQGKIGFQELGFLLEDVSGMKPF